MDLNQPTRWLQERYVLIKHCMHVVMCIDCKLKIFFDMMFFLIASLFACFDGFIPAFACFCHVSVPSWPVPRASTRSKDTFQRRVTWRQRSECDWKLTYIHIYMNMYIYTHVWCMYISLSNSWSSVQRISKGINLRLRKAQGFLGNGTVDAGGESLSGDLLGPDLTDAGVKSVWGIQWGWRNIWEKIEWCYIHFLRVWCISSTLFPWRVPRNSQEKNRPERPRSESPGGQVPQ